MTENKREAPGGDANFMWHCEVASLVMNSLPGNAATKHYVRDALRMATLSITGRNGISHASREAREARERLGLEWGKCGLVKEHVVPISQIHQQVTKTLAHPLVRHKPGIDTFGFLSLDDSRGRLVEGERTLVMGNPRSWQIAEIVRQWTVLAWISKDEDLRLRQRKLHDRMPDDWDGVDVFARYRVCGIECESIP